MTSHNMTMLIKALREETIGHDEEVNLMRKMHDDVLSRLRQELEALRQVQLVDINSFLSCKGF